MVFFFTPREEVAEGRMIYVENEDLIKYGLPVDVWFHVDKLSSAHVYARLRPGETVHDMPPELIEDCAQLVKANSIQGNKERSVDVVYTPWGNLKKTSNMEVGQVGFHDDKAVTKVHVERRVNEVVNRLNKTREERYPDLRAEREAYDIEFKAARRAQARDAKKAEVEAARDRRDAEELKSYAAIMREDAIASTQASYKNKTVKEVEDDFM